MPLAVDLPPILAAHTPHRLFQTDIGGKPPSLELRGGRGAYRRGEFLLKAGQPDVWQVAYTQRDVTTLVGQFTFQEGELRFEWMTDTFPVATYLSNTVLRLAHEKWTRYVALRKPVRAASVRAQLTRRVKYPIEVPDLPSLEEVFIEFVPSQDTLAAAYKSKIAAAIDGELHIGLDAGTESRIILHIQSLMKKKRGLQLTPLARHQQSGGLSRITKGMRGSIQQQLALGRRTLSEMQLASKIEKSRKKRRVLKTAISKTEQQGTLLQAFAEAYDASSGLALDFRVYRKFGDQQVTLLLLSDAP